MPDVMLIVHKFFPNVKRVKDASRPIEIQVTKADSSSKGRKNHKTCAMAAACKRAFHLDGAIVSKRMAYLIRGPVATRYEIPESVAREVVSFDRGGGFAPGTYRLGTPKHELGAVSRGDRGPNTRTGSYM